jgi:xanthine/CO dehydrogenase XdhC/CoxF family maturation factor
MNEFLDLVKTMKESNRPFAIATVIAVKGSASAKPGSKALINEHGKNILGWVGGGCAESFVIRNSLEAIAEGRTRIIQADLDDEIFGLGMPCGGIMDIYIEPQLPLEKIHLSETEDLKPTLTHLAQTMGFEVDFQVGAQSLIAPQLERVLYALGKGISLGRGKSFESLKEVKNIFPPGPHSSKGHEVSELLIIGNSRITEELAKFGALLKWPTKVYGWNLDKGAYPTQAEILESDAGFENFVVKKNSVVMVASHHKGDHDFIRIATESGAQYVGLIASGKRSGLILNHLSEIHVPPENIAKVFAPAGLEMDCKNPQEIALSSLCEIIRELH